MGTIGIQSGEGLTHLSGDGVFSCGLAPQYKPIESTETYRRTLIKQPRLCFVCSGRH